MQLIPNLHCCPLICPSTTCFKMITLGFRANISHPIWWFWLSSSFAFRDWGWIQNITFYIWKAQKSLQFLQHSLQLVVWIWFDRVITGWIYVTFITSQISPMNVIIAKDKPEPHRMKRIMNCSRVNGSSPIVGRGAAGLFIMTWSFNLTNTPHAWSQWVAEFNMSWKKCKNLSKGYY